MAEQQDVCCSGDAKTLIVACSGGSNAGQIANNVMIELDKKGMGKAYCLAGIGAALSGFIESAKAARTVLSTVALSAAERKHLKNTASSHQATLSSPNLVSRKPTILASSQMKQKPC